MYFDEESEQFIFDRSGMKDALAILWVCADYLVRKFEREMFSGTLDRRGYRRPGNAIERAAAQHFDSKVRFAALVLARGMNSTATESEVIRQQVYNVTFKQLEKYATQQEMLRILEYQMGQQENVTS